MADSENQKISAELSDAAALRLALTEKDSVIQKLQIDLQDAKLADSAADQQYLSKIDKLTAALKSRDEEIARLNTSMTDNRLASKKSQSEISLLKQEVESQSKLIAGLEEQSENTLTLHKKIAAQSTEIEELRARLYQGDNADASTTGDSSALDSLRSQLQQKSIAVESLQKQLVAAQRRNQATTKADVQLNDRINRLQSELGARNADVQRLAAETQGFAALKAEHEKLQKTLNSTQTQTAQRQPSVRAARNVSDANNVASTKPRVFVRPADAVSTESLTGVPEAPKATRVTYTRDGYRIKHSDGRDNLTLLPGISNRAEQELNGHGVSEFEQIIHWGKREVLHFAERSGIEAARAEGYNWPKLAGEILQGTYRRDE